MSATELCNTVNNSRTKSGIAVVSENDVINGLNKKRTVISHLLSAQLKSLSEDHYIALISILAEKYISNNNYTAGVIIEDIVDQYELRMQQIIDEKAEAVKAIIKTISPADDPSTIAGKVDVLIDALKEFDVYAQPMQIKRNQSGSTHEQSLFLAKACRNLAVELHNSAKHTEAAATLIRSLHNIFSELSDFLDLIANDEKQLDALEQQKQAAAEHQQADCCYKIDVYSNKYAVPAACTCCMKPTTTTERLSCAYSSVSGNVRTTHTSVAAMPICNDCQKHRSQFNTLIWIVRLISLSLGWITAAIAAFLGYTILGIFGSTVVVILSNIFISIFWKVKALPSEHATRSQSVSIAFTSPKTLAYSSRTGITFTFYNWEYAQRFHEANKANCSGIRTEREINSAKAVSILVANRSPVANIFKTFGGFFTEPDGKGECYYDKNMKCLQQWYGEEDQTLYACWLGDNSVAIPKDATLLTSGYFSTYFDVETNASAYGKTITVSYTIKPKTEINASANSIEVTMGALVSDSMFHTGDREWPYTHNITLLKKYGYSASGSFSFTVPNDSEALFWDTEILSFSSVYIFEKNKS